MADNKIEQMLEHLVNDDVAKAEELFHEFVVAKSREIYESLIDAEIDEAAEEDEEDEEMEEAAPAAAEEDDEDLDEAVDDEDMDENFEDIAIEADDEEMDDMDDMDAMGGDAGDDALDDMEMDGEEGPEEEKSEEELFQDLDSIVDELQAKFDELKGMEAGEHGMGDEEGEEMKDAFEPEMATVREYVEKVPAGHGAEKKGAAEKADNKKSLIDNMKNDMGGTTANILSSKEDAATYANQGALKGNGVLKGKPSDMNTKNINVPGGNAGKTAFKTKESGHGAEKKGAGENADNKQSLFRGRR
jgi:hypothetical protein